LNTICDRGPEARMSVVGGIMGDMRASSWPFRTPASRRGGPRTARDENTSQVEEHPGGKTAPLRTATSPESGTAVIPARPFSPGGAGREAGSPLGRTAPTPPAFEEEPISSSAQAQARDPGRRLDLAGRLKKAPIGLGGQGWTVILAAGLGLVEPAPGRPIRALPGLGDQPRSRSGIGVFGFGPGRETREGFRRGRRQGGRAWLS
jgi:hypothetical protein